MNILAYVHLRNIYGSTGTGRVARQIIEHLSKESNDHLHILADPLDHQKIVPKVGTPWTNFDYHFFKNETSLQQARWAFTGRPFAEDYWSEAEILYCTAESYVPTRQARLVVTLHDAAFLEQSAHQLNFSFLKQRIKWQFLYSVISQKADLILTVSHFSAERLAHFFPSMKSRLQVVYNGVHPRFFLPVSAEGETFLKQLGLTNKPFILLPRGLHYRKNADLVLKAWPILHELNPELKLVISSHCDPIYLAKAKELGDSVLVTGFVSDEALCSLYHAAQVVWFPSLYEGFGLPLIESMACGTPVVASNSSCLPEVAGNAAIIVNTSLISEHVEAIDSLLKNSGLQEAYSSQGKAHAQEFTWQSSAHKLRQHFLSLI
jgi:glycosyltransferase involved in cell wall biosynthesis